MPDKAKAYQKRHAGWHKTPEQVVINVIAIINYSLDFGRNIAGHFFGKKSCGMLVGVGKQIFGYIGIILGQKARLNEDNHIEQDTFQKQKNCR